MEFNNRRPFRISFWTELDAIFNPQFRKIREETYNIQAGYGNAEKYTTFVHYTTAEAALSIIQSKHIWMRQTTCMSDFREVEHGINILGTFFSDKSKRDLFCNTVDSCAPGAAQEAIQLFTERLNGIRLNTYITSISRHNSDENAHGRLSMWRAFGGDTGRVAIVLKAPWLLAGLQASLDELRLRFSPVAYLTQNDCMEDFRFIMENVTARREVLRSVDPKKIVNIIFSMLLTRSVCLKHSGFKEEQEWRVIYFPKLWNSPLMKDEIQVINGIPQRIYKLPLDGTVAPTLAALDFSSLFDRLIVGPTQYPWPMIETFIEALSQSGVQEPDKRISLSGIPIRT